MTDQCNFVSDRHQIRCQLETEHQGRHRAWAESGLPILVMDRNSDD